MATKTWIGGYSGATTDASNVNNWSGGALPIAGDDVYIEAPTTGSQYAITAGLSALASVALNSLNISDKFVSAIGTSSAYFQCKATTVRIGYQQTSSTGSCSPLIRLDLGSGASTINIFNSSSTATLLQGPIEIKGSNASNVLNNFGKCSVAATTGETATILTVNNNGTLKLGSGCTLTTINAISGSVELHAACTTLNISAGTVTTSESGAITTVNIYGGQIVSSSSGTITNLNIYTGTADFSSSPTSRTVTNTTIYSGGRLNLNNGIKNSVTLTTAVQTKASPGQYTIVPWTQSSIQFS